MFSTRNEIKKRIVEKLKKFASQETEITRDEAIDLAYDVALMQDAARLNSYGGYPSEIAEVGHSFCIADVDFEGSPRWRTISKRQIVNEARDLVQYWRENGENDPDILDSLYCILEG